MRRNKKKRIIIISLIGILALMTAGYAAFQTNLDIKGTSKVSSNWNVLITNVTESNKEGEAETVGNPSWTDLTAYMEANLYQKGDFVEYDVTVENRGTLDAKLDSITDNIKSSNEAIKITFSGYTKGEKLYKNTNKIIKVKIEYNPDFTGTPEEGSGEISVDLNYTQAEGGTITPTDKYLVTYDCTSNGGKDCSSYNEYLNEGDTVNLLKTATKEGFKFLGWNTNKNSNEILTELSMLNENITLYAIFQDITPPECELRTTDITLDNIKVKANCTDDSEILKYELSENDEEYINKKLETEYSVDPYSISKVKIKVSDTSGNYKIYQFNEEYLQNIYQEIYKLINNKYTKLIEKENDYNNNFLNKTYPIGSIYIAVDNRNPSEIFGGTWESYGTGRNLVGVNPNDSNFNTVGKTGGTINRTLAVANMPSHTHSIPALSGTAASAGTHNHLFKYAGSQQMYYSGYPYSNVAGTSAVYVNFYLGNSNNSTGITSIGTDGAHTHSVTTNSNTTGSNGSGASFTNLPPYTTVYMWKRVS